MISLAHAHNEDFLIQTASELRDWCEMESEAKFIGEGRTPYNWTANYTEHGNAFLVEGNWRVDYKEVKIVCRAARGARAKYATMQIVPSS